LVTVKDAVEKDLTIRVMDMEEAVDILLWRQKSLEYFARRFVSTIRAIPRE